MIPLAPPNLVHDLGLDGSVGRQEEHHLMLQQLLLLSKGAIS